MRIPAQRAGAKAEFTLGPWDNGINEKAEPGILGPADLRAAVNILLDETPGLATKHFGNTEVANLPSGNPPKFGYTFKKNDGTEYLLLSDGVTLYVTTDLVVFTELITGLDDTAYLQFETAEDRCWIGNGVDYKMWYDGTNFVVMNREYGAAVTATTEAGTDQTHIVDADLTQADDYWNLRKVVITSGAYAGMEGTVTDFDAATDKLTISGFTADPGVGVTYMVGLVMPKGRIMRFVAPTLFIGGTSENRSEIRFNRLDDPDTGYQMSLDNPRAWPATYQLEITQDDGDQVWTFSPCYRNRTLVTKGTAIYRLEPDPTYQYVPVLVSQEVGCRYPDAWAVKDELLHFMGNERSGLLDLYVTDMVSVKPRHKDGRMLPSFEEMARSEPLYKYIARANADQFDTGEKSTLCKTSAGRLECREISSKSDWDEIITTKTDLILQDQAAGSIIIDGIPLWPVKYEANDLPTAAAPIWVKYGNGAYAEGISSGKLVNTFSINQWVNYYRNDVFDASKNTLVAFRIKQGSTDIMFNNGVQVQNGTKQIQVKLMYGRLWINGANIVACDVSDYKTFHILLDKDGNGSVYVDGARVWTGAGITAVGTIWYTENSILYFAGSPNSGSRSTYLDFIYEDADFLYTAAEYPVTINSTGSVVVKINYTRAPDAFGKLWITLGADFTGTAEAGTDATHIVDADLTGENDFWNGRTVTITSGTYNGGTGLVTAYDSATKKLTVSGLAGDPGVGATFQINRGGTVGIETQSSADDSVYSALAALTNGQAPAVDNATPLAQYLKIKITLTRLDVVTGPEIKKLIGGFLWRMQAAQVGVNITAWRKYVDEITKPAGTTLVSKIRLATTLTAPVEGDWGAWQTIITGENIGTILSDTPPPAAGTGRWLDVKVEGGPSAAGVTPNLENFLLNWQEGESVRLTLAAFVYKKRLYLTGISSTALQNDRFFVLDTRQAWTKFIGQNLNRIITFRGLIYGLSSTDDKIFQQEVDGKYSDGTTAIDAYLEPGALDFGHQRFEITKIKVGSAGVTSSIQVSLSYDGVTWTVIGTMAFTADGTQILYVPHGRIGKRHFVRLRVAAAEAMAVSMVKISGVFKAEE